MPFTNSSWALGHQLTAIVWFSIYVWGECCRLGGMLFFRHFTSSLWGNYIVTAYYAAFRRNSNWETKQPEADEQYKSSAWRTKPRIRFMLWLLWYYSSINAWCNSDALQCCPFKNFSNTMLNGDILSTPMSIFIFWVLRKGKLLSGHTRTFTFTCS